VRSQVRESWRANQMALQALRPPCLSNPSLGTSEPLYVHEQEEAVPRANPSRPKARRNGGPERLLSD
jgi:hypothetical protein